MNYIMGYIVTHISIYSLCHCKTLVKIKKIQWNWFLQCVCTDIQSVEHTRWKYSLIWNTNIANICKILFCLKTIYNGIYYHTYIYIQFMRLQNASMKKEIKMKLIFTLFLYVHTKYRIYEVKKIFIIVEYKHSKYLLDFIYFINYI